ncbi:MAG: C69 family dipeptidase [Erysipelotrichaceae bacterium]|nr:C69 family dipeptidase [Erysipelotrichaceae bacterium]
MKTKKNIRNFLTKTFAVIITAAVATFVCASSVFACTAIYIGPEVSDDGSTIIVRSNDYQDVWPNYVMVCEAVENVPGRTAPVDNDDTVFAELPATTYKYTCTPWMDSATEYNGLESDAAAAVNEYGVSMTMSISAFSNDEALNADPLIENGLTEFTADSLVICQSKTAREAVEVLANLIDTYGSSECNIALIADQSEAWYVEMYTGHEYAAVKLPKDKVCYFGNEFSLEYLSDYEESIVSDHLLSLPEENGFAKYNENGELDLLATYSLEFINYSHMRTWIGHKTMAPSAYGDYSIDERYPLVFTPDNKVSLNDCLDLIRNRYEGTEYSPDDTKRTDMRVAGTDTALSVHAIQIYSDLPADRSAITWVSSGPAIAGVFVPVSNAVTSIADCYGLNQSYDDFGQFDYNTYAYYTFKGLTTLAVTDYNAYGAPIKDYFESCEAIMSKEIRDLLVMTKDMDSSEASAVITDYCTAMEEQAFADGKQLMNDLLWYMSQNSNTMKRGRNPETHEATDTDKVVTPMTVKLDNSNYHYEYNPESVTPAAPETSSANNTMYVVLGVCAAAAAVALIIAKSRKK